VDRTTDSPPVETTTRGALLTGLCSQVRIDSTMLVRDWVPGASTTIALAGAAMESFG
jgi:hypothetical protein